MASQHPPTAEPEALAPTRRALTSPALCQIFQVLAGGTGSPSALAKALSKSKHAVSLQLAQLKEGGLIQETPHPSGDARRKRYVPAWERIGRIFAHDHRIELDLFFDHLLADEESRQQAASPDRLVVSGTGRLLAVGRRALERRPPEEVIDRADQAVQATIWGFQRFFEAYLAARTFPTLREYLRGAYQELVRYADELPEEPALSRFMAFQARVFGDGQGVGELLDQALADTGGPPASQQAPSPAPETLQSFEPIGHETADGAYVLQEGAQAIIQQGLPIEVHRSYVHRAEHG